MHVNKNIHVISYLYSLSYEILNFHSAFLMLYFAMS